MKKHTNTNPEFNSAISYNNSPKKLEIDFKYAMHYSPRIKSLDVKKRRQSSLLLIIKGEYKYTAKEFSFTATNGDMLFLPCFSKYSYEIVSEETEAMQVEFDIYSPKHSASISLCKTPILIKDCIKFKDTFQRIVNCQNNTRYAESFRLMSDLYSLLNYISENIDQSYFNNHYGKITPAINYIQSNFNSKIYVSKLAKMCNLSESQLRRLFSDVMKMSPIEYKNKLRANYAIKMLNNGYVNISEIAESMNFENVYAFSQFFKKETGFSPTKYKGL